MNKNELKNSSLLKDLIEYHGVIGIKTSFEDEGASFTEVTRLKELCNQAGTKLLLKIQGAEAKRDIEDSLVIGVKGIVAPMIESPFALDKFVESLKTILPEDVRNNLQIGVNIETINAVKQFEEICKSDGFNALYNITLGRVDLVKSLGKNRSFVDSEEIFEMVRDISTQAKELSKKVYVGGAVTVDSKDFLSRLNKKGLLDKFETRYVIYDPAIALKNLEKALLEGQKLELGILENRRNIYLHHANKEVERIEMIKKRIGNNPDN